MRSVCNMMVWLDVGRGENEPVGTDWRKSHVSISSRCGSREKGENASNAPRLKREARRWRHVTSQHVVYGGTTTSRWSWGVRTSGNDDVCNAYNVQLWRPTASSTSPETPALSRERLRDRCSNHRKTWAKPIFSNALVTAIQWREKKTKYIRSLLRKTEPLLSSIFSLSLSAGVALDCIAVGQGYK